jgi:glycerol-3-phosphate acyltransferase PlsY
MMLWLSGVAVVFGYLVGSFPTAYLAARRASNGVTDIRTAGDGNAGANNVARIVGRRWGIAVAVADIAKGVAAVALFNLLTHLFRPSGVENSVTAPGLLAGIFTVSGLGMLAGVATMAGQIWPAWSRFRGGRGAATALGVVGAVLPGPVFLMLLPAGVILFTTRSTTLALAFIYLASAVVAKAIFGVDWGPIVYCLGIFVAVGLVHFWTIRFRNPSAESTSPA